MIIKNIHLTYPGISKQKTWKAFKAVTGYKGLYNGLSAAYGVYNFKNNIINSSGVYKFPAKTLEYIQ